MRVSLCEDIYTCSVENVNACTTTMCEDIYTCSVENVNACTTTMCEDIYTCSVENVNACTTTNYMYYILLWYIGEISKMLGLIVAPERLHNILNNSNQ